LFFNSISLLLVIVGGFTASIRGMNQDEAKLTLVKWNYDKGRFSSLDEKRSEETAGKLLKHIDSLIDRPSVQGIIAQYEDADLLFGSTANKNTYLLIALSDSKNVPENYSQGIRVLSNATLEEVNALYKADMAQKKSANIAVLRIASSQSTKSKIGVLGRLLSRGQYFRFCTESISMCSPFVLAALCVWLGLNHR